MSRTACGLPRMAVRPRQGQHAGDAGDCPLPDGPADAFADAARTHFLKNEPEKGSSPLKRTLIAAALLAASATTAVAASDKLTLRTAGFWEAWYDPSNSDGQAMCGMRTDVSNKADTVVAGFLVKYVPGGHIFVHVFKDSRTIPQGHRRAGIADLRWRQSLDCERRRRQMGYWLELYRLGHQERLHVVVHPAVRRCQFDEARLHARQ